jgi:hypothetical protein
MREIDEETGRTVDNFTPERKKMPYLLALLIGVTLTCILSSNHLYNSMLGKFINWELIANTPTGIMHIINADLFNIWLRTSNGQIYQYNYRCEVMDACSEWIKLNDETEIVLSGKYPGKSDEHCIGRNGLQPAEPPEGELRECFYINGAGYPGPEVGVTTYFALMADGSLLRWERTGGFADVFVFVFSVIFLSICTGFIITIGYLIPVVVNKIKDQRDAKSNIR